MTNADLWKKNILETVKYLSDKKMQQKGWFEFCNYSSTPDELYCSLFDDNSIEYFLTSAQTNLTDRQIQAGKHLINQMNIYEEKHTGNLDPKKVINDPDWNNVRASAKIFYKILQDQQS